MCTTRIKLKKIEDEVQNAYQYEVQMNILYNNNNNNNLQMKNFTL